MCEITYSREKSPTACHHASFTRTTGSPDDLKESQDHVDQGWKVLTVLRGTEEEDEAEFNIDIERAQKDYIIDLGMPSLWQAEWHLFVLQVALYSLPPSLSLSHTHTHLPSGDKLTAQSIDSYSVRLRRAANEDETKRNESNLDVHKSRVEVVSFPLTDHCP